MFVTPAYAQAAGGGDPMSAFGQFIPLILIFVIFYFLLIRPQQKKAKQHAQMVQNLRRGDQVLTAGGIIAKVIKVGAPEEVEVEVEIAKDVKVKLDRRTITVVMSKTEPANSN